MSISQPIPKYRKGTITFRFLLTHVSRGKDVMNIFLVSLHHGNCWRTYVSKLVPHRVNYWMKNVRFYVLWIKEFGKIRIVRCISYFALHNNTVMLQVNRLPTLTKPSHWQIFLLVLGVRTASCAICIWHFPATAKSESRDFAPFEWPQKSSHVCYIHILLFMPVLKPWAWVTH